MTKKEFIAVLSVTLIVILVWVVSDLVHTQSASQQAPDVKKYLEPITPDFDKQTLDRITALSTPAPAPSAVPVSTPTPGPSLSPNPTASASATPQATASATPR